MANFLSHHDPTVILEAHSAPQASPGITSQPIVTARKLLELRVRARARVGTNTAWGWNVPRGIPGAYPSSEAFGDMTWWVRVG